MRRAPMTQKGAERLRGELDRLKSVERPRIIQAIAEARAHGDLKENAEYHAAKEDQAHLETRILRLRQRLRKATVVEVDSEPAAGGSTSTFAFGRSAEVTDESTGETHTWTIVGVTEADRAAGKLSAESPVARALLGQPAGATVSVQTPKGTRRLKIERVL